MLTTHPLLLPLLLPFALDVDVTGDGEPFMAKPSIRLTGELLSGDILCPLLLPLRFGNPASPASPGIPGSPAIP